MIFSNQCWSLLCVHTRTRRNGVQRPCEVNQQRLGSGVGETLLKEVQETQAIPRRKAGQVASPKNQRLHRNCSFSVLAWQRWIWLPGVRWGVFKRYCRHDKRSLSGCKQNRKLESWRNQRRASNPNTCHWFHSASQESFWNVESCCVSCSCAGYHPFGCHHNSPGKNIW